MSPLPRCRLALMPLLHWLLPAALLLAGAAHAQASISTREATLTALTTLHDELQAISSALTSAPELELAFTALSELWLREPEAGSDPLVLNATFGSSTAVQVKVTDVRLDLDHATAQLTSSGRLRLDGHGHHASLSWNGSLSAPEFQGATAAEVLGNLLADVDSSGFDLALQLAARLNSHGMNIDLSLTVAAGGLALVELTTSLNGAGAFSVTGELDLGTAELDGILDGLTVSFAAEQLALEQFLVELERLILR